MNSSLLSIFSFDVLSRQAAVTEITALNEKTEQYGLSLTPQDVTELVQARSEVLSANGRVEVGGGTIGRIVEVFCDSSFINQREYTAILHELLEIFYYAKSVTRELISDDDLIEYMKDCFENRCMGSLELLKGRELENLVERLRSGTVKEEEQEDDEYDGEEYDDEQ